VPIPGFTSGGGGGVKSPEELIASDMGFTEEDGGQAYVPPPPPPPAPIPQAPVGFTEEEAGPAYAPAFEEPAYDPWTDELSQTTPAAEYWEPPAPPPATGVDYFGIDDATAYQGDPNGSTTNYVTDSEMFGLPEMGMFDSGVDFFNMGVSAPGAYLPDEVMTSQQMGLPTFDEIAYGLQNSGEILSGITTRINEILGIQDPNATEITPTTDSELGIAMATQDWTKYDALVAEYQALLDQSVPLYESYQQQAGLYNALTSMSGEGPMGMPTDSMLMAGIQTPFEGPVGFSGGGIGEGIGQLPSPFDSAANRQNYAERDFNRAQIDAERLALEIAAQQQLATMGIFNAASPETQAEMRSYWIEQGIGQATGTSGYDMRSGALNVVGVVPDRMIFGDQFVANEDLPTYFNEREVALDERDRFHRVGDTSTLRSPLPDPTGRGKGGVTRAFGALESVGDALAPIANANLLWATPAAPLMLVSSRVRNWVPDLSSKALGLTAWNDLGGSELFNAAMFAAEAGARSTFALARYGIIGPVQSTPPGTGTTRIVQPRPETDYSMDTFKRVYFDQYNALPLAARLGMEAIADPFGFAVVGPSVFRPLKLGATAAANANRARLTEQAYQTWTLRNWVTTDDWTKFFEVTQGGGKGFVRTPREIRHVESLARTFGSGLIDQGIVTKVGDPETQRGIALALGTKLAIQSVTDGYRNGFDALVMNTRGYEMLKAAKQFAVDTLGYTQKEADAFLDIRPEKVDKWAADMGVLVEVKRDPTTDPVELMLRRQAEAVGVLETQQLALPAARTANPLAQPAPLPLPRGFTPAPPRTARPLPKLTDEQKVWLNQLHYNTTTANTLMQRFMRGEMLNAGEAARLEKRMNAIAELAVKIHVAGAGDLSNLMESIDGTFVDLQKLADEYELWRGTIAMDASTDPTVRPVISARQIPSDRGRGPGWMAYAGGLHKENDELRAIVAQFEARLADIETRLAQGESQLRAGASPDPVIPELAEAYQADISLELLTQVERLSRNYGQNFWATIKAEGGGQITRAATLDWYQRFTAAEVKGATTWQKARLHNVYAALEGHPVDPNTPKGRWADQVDEIVTHGTVSDINQLLEDIERGYAVPGRDPLRFMGVDEYLTRNPEKVFRKGGVVAETTTRADYEAAGFRKFDENAPPSLSQLKTLARQSQIHQRDLLKQLEESPVVSYTTADTIMNSQPITPAQRGMLDQTFKRGAISKKEYDDLAKLTHKEFATKVDKGKYIGEDGQVYFEKTDSVLLRKGDAKQAAINKVWLAGDWSYSEAEMRQAIVTKIVDMFPLFTLDQKTATLVYDPDVPKFAFGAPGDADAILALADGEFKGYIKSSGLMHKRKGFKSKWYAGPIATMMSETFPAFDPTSPSIVGVWQHEFQELVRFMTSDRVRLDELAEFSEVMAGFYKTAPDFKKAPAEAPANPFIDRPLESAVEELSTAFTTWMARGSSPQARADYRRLHEAFAEEYVTRKGALTPEELPPFFPTKKDAESFMGKDLESLKADLHTKGIPIPGEGIQADVNAVLISRLHEQNLDLVGDAWADIIDAADDFADLGDPIRPWLDDMADLDAADIEAGALTPVSDQIPWTDPASVPDQVGVIKGSLVDRARGRAEARSEAPVVHPDPLREAPPASVTLTASGNAQRQAYMDGLREQADKMGWNPATRAGAAVITDILALRAVADGWIADVGEYYRFGKADAKGLYQSGVQYIDAPAADDSLGVYTRAVSGLDTRGNPINPSAHTPDPRPFIALFKQGEKGQRLTDDAARRHTVVTYLHENLHHWIDLMPDAQAKALYEAAMGPADENWTRAMLHQVGPNSPDEKIAREFEKYLAMFEPGSREKMGALGYSKEQLTAFEGLRQVIKTIWQKIRSHLPYGDVSPGMRDYFDRVFGDVTVTFVETADGRAFDVSLIDAAPLPAAADLPPGPPRILALREIELDAQFKHWEKVRDTLTKTQGLKFTDPKVKEANAQVTQFKRSLDETRQQIAQFKTGTGNAGGPATSSRFESTGMPDEVDPEWEDMHPRWLNIRAGLNDKDGYRVDLASDLEDPTGLADLARTQPLRSGEVPISSNRTQPKETAAQQIARANRWKKENQQRVHVPGVSDLTGGEIGRVMADFDREIRRFYSYEEHIPSFKTMLKNHHNVGVTPMGWLDWGTKKAVRWDMWTKQTQVTRTMDIIGTLMRGLVDEAHSLHQGRELDFIMDELTTAAVNKDFTKIIERLPDANKSEYMQEALRTISRHLADTKQKDVPNLLGKAERFFSHHSPTGLVVDLMPDRIGSATAYRASDLKEFDRIMTGTGRETGWDDDEWEAVQVLRDTLKDEWTQVKGQFRDGGDWKKSVPVQEIDTALGKLDPWNPADAERFVENVATYIGAREATRIGYDPDTIPMPLKLMMAVKNQMAPFWLTLSVSYHVNNMVGNLAGWIVANIRNDVNSPLRRPGTYYRVRSQLGSGVADPYTMNIGSYTVGKGKGGELKRLRSDSLKARLLDPEKQGFTPATETRTLQDEIGRQLGKAPRQRKFGSDARWFERSWAHLPIARQTIGVANITSGVGEQLFRELIFGNAWEWTYNRGWAAKLGELDLADNVTRDLREAAGFQEVARVLDTHKIQGEAREAIVSAQRKVLADARYDGYHAAKTGLRDYRMRNRLDGVLDQVFPIHFWTQKNALMVGQTFAQRPALIPLAIKAFEEHRERRADAPAHLREGYLGEINLASVLGDHAPAPFHLRLANITNPALWTIPKLLDRDKWDLDSDAGALEILFNLGQQAPGNLYTSLGFRIGPHLDGAGRVAQAVLGDSAPGVGDRVARLSDFLATNNGYKNELFPYQFAAAGWASNVPYGGDELQDALMGLDQLVGDSGFTRNEWLYKVSPALADIGESKTWTAEYQLAVLAAMKGDADDVPVPSWVGGGSAAQQWREQLESDAMLIRSEVYRREATRTVKGRTGQDLRAVGIYHDTGMDQVASVKRVFFDTLNKAQDTVGRQAAIDKFADDFQQDRHGFDTWMPLFEAWLKEGRHFGGLFSDPAASLARVRGGDLSDPLFLLFTAYAEGETARHATVVTNKAGKQQYKWETRDRNVIALDRAYQAAENWLSTRDGVSFDAAYGKLLGTPDKNGEHQGIAPELYAVLAASDNFDGVLQDILRNTADAEYTETQANRNRVLDLKSAEFDRTAKLKDEVYGPWAPYFEEREAIDTRWESCTLAAGGSMAGQHACNATRGRELGEYNAKTDALRADGTLPDIGPVSKLYPSWPWQSDFERDLATPASELYGKERAANEFKKTAFFSLDASEQERILELAKADDQRGELIDRVLADAGIGSHDENGVPKKEYMDPVDTDGDGVTDYSVFNWERYHADVAAAVEGGLDAVYRDWIAQINQETAGNGNFFVHLNPSFRNLTVEDALYHTRNKEATVDAWWAGGKAKVDAYHEQHKANETYGTPMAEAEELAITREYGPGIWGGRNLSNQYDPDVPNDPTTYREDTIYREGINQVSEIYYSLTPQDQAEWKERYPDLFIDVENDPTSKNPGLTHKEFAKSNLTTAQMTEILHQYGYDWSPVVTDPDAPEGWTKPASEDQRRESGRLNEATIVESHLDQAVTVVLNEEEQARLQAWKDFTSNPLEAGAQNLLDTAGEYLDRKSGETRKSWGRVEEHIADLMASTDPTDPGYGDLNAMFDYVQARRALSEEVNVGELYDKQAAWFATLDVSTQETLLREDPQTFERMADPDQGFGAAPSSGGGSSGGNASSSGDSDSKSGSSSRTSTSRSSTASGGGSAPRSSVGSGSGGTGRAGEPATSGSGRVLPALTALDPGLADGPDSAERMVYASAVADWFDTAIFPLIQLAPQGKWRDWMSWLTMAGVAMVRTRLGTTPTLETWRLLAEELGMIDLSLLDDVLAKSGAPEELVEQAEEYVPDAGPVARSTLPSAGAVVGRGVPAYGFSD
jgi:hypothetical protein